MAMNADLPELVRVAHERAEEVGFDYSCDPDVGQLLAVLAARVPEGGRILAIGTGLGAGVGWLVSGLGPRTDVTVTTIESDPERAGLAAQGWPEFVDPRVGDAAVELAHGSGVILATAR
jgi:demethylmenaquinone methyltransferase/2-methoxy-6-polyprenyl-1,4-benzoquinol methylase